MLPLSKVFTPATLRGGYILPMPIFEDSDLPEVGSGSVHPPPFCPKRKPGGNHFRLVTPIGVSH